MWLCTWETVTGKEFSHSRWNPGICTLKGHHDLFWIGVRHGGWKSGCFFLSTIFFKLVDFLKVGYVRALNKERDESVNSALHCKSGQTRTYRWLKETERTTGPVSSIYNLGKVRPENLLRAHKYHCRETQDFASSVLNNVKSSKLLSIISLS